MNLRSCSESLFSFDGVKIDAVHQRSKRSAIIGCVIRWLTANRLIVNWPSAFLRFGAFLRLADKLSQSSFNISLQRIYQCEEKVNRGRKSKSFSNFSDNPAVRCAFAMSSERSANRNVAMERISRSRRESPIDRRLKCMRLNCEDKTPCDPRYQPEVARWKIFRWN